MFSLYITTTLYISAYLEGDLGDEGVTMVDDGRPVITVPAVKLHTPATRQENPAIQLH